MFMPTRSKSRKPPPASPGKRLLHAFYLAQPFLQFFALMAVLFVLGRCSPLSPSQDRSVVKTFSDNSVRPSESALTQAEEIDINNSLKPVSELQTIAVISETSLAKMSAQSVHADMATDDAHLRDVFMRRGPGVHLLVLPFQPEHYEKFFRDGSARIDLAARLKGMDDQVRKFYFGELNRAEHKRARIYLIVSDAAAQKLGDIRSVAIHANVQLGFPRAEKAYLKLVRQEQPLEERDAEVIKSVLAQQPKLAVVLE